MRRPDDWYVVGLDNGGNSNNATLLRADGSFVVDGMVETPSRVTEGPQIAVEALADALENVLAVTSTARSSVRAIGLDTPGPASADGVISSKGSTNFAHPAWRGFDFRGALEARLGLPVVYNNDGNAAALYAHHATFGAEAGRRSSISAIVGTGLGGGVIEAGRVVRGASGMAGELGHVHIPMEGLLGEEQPMPHCNCGINGDAESVASLTGIEMNLLPYWLAQFPGHDLGKLELPRAAKLARGYAENGDELALKVFEQQAMALGRLFTIASNFTDPDAFFVGGGVVETAPDFRDWFLATVRVNTNLREEQAKVTTFALVPDLDMAGARGAVAALESLTFPSAASRRTARGRRQRLSRTDRQPGRSCRPRAHRARPVRQFLPAAQLVPAALDRRQHLVQDHLEVGELGVDVVVDLDLHAPGRFVRVVDDPVGLALGLPDDLGLADKPVPLGLGVGEDPLGASLTFTDDLVAVLDDELGFAQLRRQHLAHLVEERQHVRPVDDAGGRHRHRASGLDHLGQGVELRLDVDTL